MFTKTIDTDSIVMSFLDISTIAYMKQINKYFYEWTKKIPEISCTNMYPLTKSLLETENFIENSIDRIYSRLFDGICTSVSKRETDTYIILLKCYARYRYPIDIIKEMVERIDNIACLYETNFFSDICGYTTYENIKWFMTKGFRPHQNIVSTLVKNHRNEILESLLAENEISISFADVYECIVHNNLEAFRIFLNIGVPIDTIYFDTAVECYNTEFIDFFMDNDFPLSHYALNGIGRTGNTVLLYKILKRLDMSNIPDDLSVLEYAAERGDKEMILLLLEKKLKKKNTVTAYAAKYCARINDIRFMKWLLDMGFGKHEDAYEYAIEYENTHVLNWLLRNKFPIPKGIFQKILCNVSSAKMLNWLLENNFDIEDKNLDKTITRDYNSHCVYYNLIKHQNIDILVWLKENKIPYDENCVLNWMCESYVNKYSNPKTINTIKWLIMNSYTIPCSAFFFCVCIENFDLVDILIKYNAPYHKKIILFLAKNKRYVMLKYLLRKNISYDEETYNYLIESEIPEIKNLVYPNKMTEQIIFSDKSKNLQ